MNATISAAAPSASAAPAVPAPSAAPAAPVQIPIPITNTLEHFANLAKADLAKGASISAPAPAATEPPAAVIPPVAPVPTEPPAVPVPTPQAAPVEPDPAAPVQTLEPEEAEPSPEEQAAWSEGEKRIYGALQKERTARKEAKAKLKQQSEENTALKDRLDKLEAKLTGEPPAANEPQQPNPNTAAVPGALGECHTFEAVDAQATKAASTEAFAMRLQHALAKQGAAPVVEALRAKGVTHLDGVPIAEAGEEVLSEFLTTVYEGARITQTQAEPRKRYLVNQAQAWQEAVKWMPELADPKSERAQRFVQVINANQSIRQMGPNWPVIAVKYLLGDEAAAVKAAPARPAAPALQPTPTPPVAATRQVPSAPRATQPTPPKKSDYEEAAAKVATGKATLADITAMARAGLATG